MEIYQKKFILVLYLLLLLVVFCGLLYLLRLIPAAPAGNRFLVLALCVFLLLLVGTAIIFGVIGICSKPKLVLKITDDGFEHRGIGFVKWNNVTDLYIMSSGLLNFIQYKVSNYSEITNDWSFFKKMLQHNADQSFSISLAGTGQNINKVAEIMQAYIVNSNS